MKVATGLTIWFGAAMLTIKEWEFARYLMRAPGGIEQDIAAAATVFLAIFIAILLFLGWALVWPDKVSS